MKQGRILLVVLLAFCLLSSIAFAEQINADTSQTSKKAASWGTHKWSVMLESGRLSAMGHQGAWKGKSYLIDNGVTKFWTVGTGIGLLVVYQQGDLLYMAYMDGRNGEKFFREKFYKFSFRAVHLHGAQNGASVHVVKPNKDVLVISVNDKGYKYARVIKYKK